MWLSWRKWSKGEIIVPLKLVVDGERRTVRPYAFLRFNKMWYAKYRDSSIEWQLVIDDDFYIRLFNACKPYSVLAREYPI